MSLSSHETIGDPVVAALQQYTSCDVADALLKLKHPHGGFLSGLYNSWPCLHAPAHFLNAQKFNLIFHSDVAKSTLWSPTRQEGPTKIVGPAYTVKYIGKEQDGDAKTQGHYIDNIPIHHILFISSPPRLPNAVYGGLMSARAKYSGAVGTIVDGRIRDLQEHRDLNFPVFARDVGTTAPAEVVRVGAINVPVQLQSDDQDAFIHPGDYLIGDLNGVVCIPKALAKKVIALIPSQVEADELIALDVTKGIPFAAASKERRAGVKKPEDL